MWKGTLPRHPLHFIRFRRRAIPGQSSCLKPTILYFPRRRAPSPPQRPKGTEMNFCSAVPTSILFIILFRTWTVSEVRATPYANEDDLTIYSTAVPVSLTDPSPESQRPLSADYTWAVHKARGVRPQRIIIADKLGRSIDDDTPSPSLPTAEKWGERAKLQPLSPSQWIGSNVRAKTVLGELSPSALESASGSVLTTSSSSSSPATPRPRPVSEINHPSPKPEVDLGKPSQRITELQESELLTETRRRPRSASEPRSFLAQQSRRHSMPEPLRRLRQDIYSQCLPSSTQAQSLHKPYCLLPAITRLLRCRMTYTSPPLGAANRACILVQTPARTTSRQRPCAAPTRTRTASPCCSPLS